jgi:hypothetical protein
LRTHRCAKRKQATQRSDDFRSVPAPQSALQLIDEPKRGDGVDLAARPWGSRHCGQPLFLTIVN